MATQQGAPSRPWFRLATMVRPPPPPPPNQQPDQAPRPAFIRPAFNRAPPAVAPPPNVVAPMSPPVARAPTIPNEPPPSAIATSPPSRADSPAMKVPTMTRVSSSSSSSSTISHPPSPLVLPSPQVKSYQPEYEQKTVLVQETKEKPKRLEDDMGWRSHETSKKHSDSEDVLRMRIITIAGENKGAIMDLTPSDRKTHKFTGNIKKDSPIPTPSSDVDKSGSSNSDGSRSKAKKKNQKSNLPLMNAVMNSNIQGVNNSILYDCSTTHHDPGVHLSLSRKPDGGF